MKSETKKRFIVFLKNLCNQGWDDESWQEYAVNHYTDPTLERIRQMVVEIGIEDESFQNTGKLNDNSKEKIQKIMSENFDE